MAGPPLAARLGSAVTSPTATAVSIRWSINDLRPISTRSIFDPSSSPRAGVDADASKTPSVVASGKTRRRDGTIVLPPAHDGQFHVAGQPRPPPVLTPQRADVRLSC